MKDPYITLSGQIIDLVNPYKEMFNIEDIARGLSNECRFNGQVSVFYSVAQHSIAVMRRVRKIIDSSYYKDGAIPLTPKLLMAALLHDASEAYLKDIPSPLKCLLPQYKEIEMKFMALISQRFGIVDLTDDELELIKLADMQIYESECIFLRKSHLFPKHTIEKCKEELCVDYRPDIWFGAFMREFNTLNSYFLQGKQNEAWPV